jgi:hypothetical protein
VWFTNGIYAEYCAPVIPFDLLRNGKSELITFTDDSKMKVPEKKQEYTYSCN